MKPRPCKTPGCPNLANGARCRDCYLREQDKKSKAGIRPCARCGQALHRTSKGALCSVCRDYQAESEALKRKRLAVFATEATAAPTIAKTPDIRGSVVVISDPHIPFHDPHALAYVCEIAEMLGVRRLVVGGDLLHFDEISKYDRAGETVNWIQELTSGGRVIEALAEVFTDGIDIIPGNHDQRLEKLLAKMNESKEGRKGIEVIASLLGRPNPDHAEDITYSLMAHFLGKAGVTIHTLPDVTINGYWLVQHPGSVSRIPPQNERKMVAKHRKAVIQGHSHLFGVGFDESGQDIAFNCGHMAMEEKWRYVRERPTHFPRAVKGFGIIYQTPTAPQGRLIPVALHDRWFDLRELAAMLGASGCGQTAR